MSTIGEELRQGREAKGLSVREVHGMLGMPEHYLRAMESGGSPLIADEFYLVPYLRRYAEFLERDPTLTVSRFLSEAARGDEASLATSRKGLPMIPTAWVLAVSAAVLGAAALAWSVLG